MLDNKLDDGGQISWGANTTIETIGRKVWKLANSLYNAWSIEELFALCSYGHFLDHVENLN